MIVPYKHTGNLQKWKEVIKKAMAPDGFNIGMSLGRVAGAGFEDHLHYHLVPRWDGDTNFMPIISETKVIPISLKEGYDLLLKAYREIEKWQRR